jgi:hypothetical protein
MRKSFTAFYPLPPPWFVTGVDWSLVESDPAQLQKQMSEVTFETKDETFELRFARDGEVLLYDATIEKEQQEPDASPEMDTLVRRWSQYLEHLNALFLLLDSQIFLDLSFAYLQINEITNKDAYRVTYRDGIFESGSVPNMSITSTYQFCRYWPFYAGVPPRHDPRIISRLTVPSTTISKVVDHYRVLRSHDRAISRVSSLCKALAEYKVGNYETSLVLAWFIIEGILAQTWGHYIDTKNVTFPDGSKKIPSDLRERFMGRDYPVSVFSSVLLLEDIIDKKTFDAVTQARKTRNDIVHQKKGFQCNHHHPEHALQLAAQMITGLYKVPIRLNLTFSISGL